MTHIAAAHKPEILAPAGSAEALAAALAHGADAVYFGLQDGFNARARAANFSLDGLDEVVRRIHRAGARAYLTLNTLVFEQELPALENVLRRIAASGVDALIVQDPAVCLLARAVCPELELHASTQMTIASPTGARFAARLGVTRIVVPRELSVREIAEFAAGTDRELEVFVHGALCVSWSGQCLTSEAWGGRSANRGQCAQSCRMPYDLIVDGHKQELADVRYLLSPKDLAGVHAVPELIAAGVHCLKIEGRQKNAQYVATATGGYRRWLDAVAAGGDLRDARRQLGEDLLAMSVSYTRGFSDGFLAGSDHQTLVEGRFPKHRGVAVGRVVEVARASVLVDRGAEVRPWTGGLAQSAKRTTPRGELASPLAEHTGTAALELRPGLGVVFDQGDPEAKDEPGGPLFRVEELGDGRVRLGFGRPGPDLRRVRAGDRVWVTNDPQVGALHAAIPEEPAGRIPVSLKISGQVGQPLRIEAWSGAHRAVAETEVALGEARARGLDRATLEAKVGAFGGTPFHAAQSFDLDGLGEGLHVPVAELKAARRRVVRSLLEQIERGPVRTVHAEPALARLRAALASGIEARPGEVQLVPLVRSEVQLDAVLAAGVEEVELDWMEFTGLGRACERARAAGVRVTVATPRIGKPGEEALDERIHRLAPDGVLLRHWGAVERFLELRAGGFAGALHGDFSLNVTNSMTALHLLGLGLDTVTASFDLDEEQLLALLPGVPAGRLAAVVHHRIPTFHTEHCVYAHTLSEGRDYRSCGRPCERHEVAIRDHLGRDHPVIVDVGCRNTVFHHAPQQSAKVVPQLVAGGLRRLRLEFVREDARAVEGALSAWRRVLDGSLDAAGLERRTGAESFIGVR
ncbi:MAG: DUF3656 domain-containing U32 family peptidase [Planctomycetota bacterium]